MEYKKLSCLVLLYLGEILGDKIPKCCRLGEILENGGCVMVARNTTIKEVRVEGGMVTFNWLGKQNMLREAAMPRCLRPNEVYPDFSETSSSKQKGPQLTSDGVFVHELRYFLPSAFCVDQSKQVLDYEYPSEFKVEEVKGMEDEYITVVTCDEKGKDIGRCTDLENCHPRCCEPWQLYKDGRCHFSPSNSAYSPSSLRETRMPQCILDEFQEFNLENKGLRQGGRLVPNDSYCLTGKGGVMVCRPVSQEVRGAQEVSLVKQNNTSVSSISIFMLLLIVTYFSIDLL